MNINEVNFRPAVQTDMPFVTQIYNEAIAAGGITADDKLVDMDSRIAIWQQITINQKRPFWVAVHQNTPIAYFYLRNFYDRPAYQITAEIGIYITTSFIGHGLGSKILDFCIVQATQIQIKNILALIFSSNVQSIFLFEKFGFKKNGFLPALAKFDNKYEDLVILQKIIN